MKKINLLAFLLCTSIGFAQTPTSDAYASTIESEDLRQLLYVYASDFFQGRETGTLGQKRAVTFLKEFYESRGIQAAAGSEDYFQKMTLNIKGEEIDTENVVAIIEGSEKPEEYLVISSHLDHIGTHEGEINNGAEIIQLLNRCIKSIHIHMDYLSNMVFLIHRLNYISLME